MERRVVFNDHDRLILLRLSGPVGVEDVQDVRDYLRGHLGGRSDWRVLADVRDIEIDFRFNDVRALEASRLFSLGRMAVVVSRKNHFGIVRQYSAIAPQDLDMRVFYDLDEACRWLGIESDEIGALDDAPENEGGG